MINNIRIDGQGASIHISADRLNKNLVSAVDYLGEQILMDCTKFVPMRNGVLRNLGHAESSGTDGEVIWEGPYAHYQYEGILYVGEESGSAFAQLGERKIPAVPEKKLTYSTEGSGDHWFEKANAQYGQEWIKRVKEIAGDGN